MREEFDIVHTVRLYAPNIGGMELIVQQIAERQVAEGKKVAVFTSGYCRNGDTLPRTESIQGVTVIRAPSLSVANHIFINPFKAALFPWSVKANVLHVHGVDSFVDFVRMAIAHKRLLLSPHGGFFHTKSLAMLKRLYWGQISRRLYRCATGMSISREDQKLIEPIVERSFLMGCGYKERDVTAEGRDILILGRVSDNKNTQGSIDLAEEMRGDRQVQVVGPIEAGMQLKRIENVKVLGALPDSEVEYVIAQCEFFVCLSSYEGLGMTMVEALHAGLRCVVSNIPTFVEIASSLPPEAAQEYVYFWDDDMTELVAWIGRAPRFNRAVIRKAVKERYSWASVTAKLGRLCSETDAPLKCS